MGRHYAEMVQLVGGDEKEGREGKDGGIASTQGGANDQKCGRKCGSLAQNLQACNRRGADLGHEEEVVRLLDRCEAKMKEWAKHWQCDEEVQNFEEMLWKMGGSGAKVERVCF